jgi:SAM-dependent methyltransferase
MKSMIIGGRLDVGVVSSTGADSYALGYSDAEFRRLKFQGEYLRDFTADVLRRAGIAPGMRVLDIGCGVGDVSLVAAEIVSSSGTVLGVDRSEQAVAAARPRQRELTTFVSRRLNSKRFRLTNDSTPLSGDSFWRICPIRPPCSGGCQALFVLAARSRSRRWCCRSRAAFPTGRSFASVVNG